MKTLFKRRILALDVHAQSFAFVVFDGPHALLDWGGRSFRSGVNVVKVPMETKLRLLFDAYRPDVLVIRTPRNEKRRKVVATIAALAGSQRIPVIFVSGSAVRQTFSPSDRNKYQIAATIATRHPELLPRLPSQRKPWQSEKYGINVFEAAAAGIVYFGGSVSPREP